MRELNKESSFTLSSENLLNRLEVVFLLYVKASVIKCALKWTLELQTSLLKDYLSLRMSESNASSELIAIAMRTETKKCWSKKESIRPGSFLLDQSRSLEALTRLCIAR